MELFSTPVLQVTSKTRAKWSPAEAYAFQLFAENLRDSGINSSGLPTSLDIKDLLSSLNLTRFANMTNVEGDKLGPILEVKVYRKIQSVWKELPTLSSPPGTRKKTRLRTAYALAIKDGVDPPTSLAKPKAVYTPEPWSTKAKPKTTKKKPASSVSSSGAATIEEARMEVNRLKQLLRLAEQKLTNLCQAEGLNGANTVLNNSEDDDDDNDQSGEEQDFSMNQYTRNSISARKLKIKRLGFPSSRMLPKDTVNSDSEDFIQDHNTSAHNARRSRNHTRISVIPEDEDGEDKEKNEIDILALNHAVSPPGSYKSGQIRAKEVRKHNSVAPSSRASSVTANGDSPSIIDSPLSMSRLKRDNSRNCTFNPNRASLRLSPPISNSAPEDNDAEDGTEL